MTIDSPWTLGSVTTRRSTCLESIVRPTRPSCGMRRSAMSRSLMIFTRLIAPATMRLGIVVVSCSTPSTRKRTRSSRPSGAKWMSEAPCSTPWAMIELTSLMTGASSALSRRSTISATSAAPSSIASCTTSSRRLRRADQGEDVLAGGDGRQGLHAGDEGDLVDRHDVAGVGHRKAELRLADERDRDGLVALGLRRADEVRGGHVDLEDREVEMVEAVALRDGTRQLLLVDDALLQECLLEGRAGDPRRLVCVFDAFAIGEPQLDDHVLQEALATSGPRAGDAVPFGIWHHGRAPRPSGGMARPRVADGDGRGSCGAMGRSRRTASRMTGTGAGRPVQASRLSAPCCTSISSPSTIAHPPACAASRSGVPPGR